jgi:hypothetical protein
MGMLMIVLAPFVMLVAIGMSLLHARNSYALTQLHRQGLVWLLLLGAGVIVLQFIGVWSPLVRSNVGDVGLLGAGVVFGSGLYVVFVRALAKSKWYSDAPK